MVTSHASHSPIALHCLAHTVSDVLMRAQKWRKKALATKKTGEDSEVPEETPKCGVIA